MHNFDLRVWPRASICLKIMSVQKIKINNEKDIGVVSGKQISSSDSLLSLTDTIGSEALAIKESGTVAIYDLNVENLSINGDIPEKIKESLIGEYIDNNEYACYISDENDNYAISIYKSGEVDIPLLKNETRILSKVDEKISEIVIPEQENHLSTEVINNNIRLFRSVICLGDSVTDGHLFRNGRGCHVARDVSYVAQLQK